jgi:ribonuclease P protein component
VIGRIVRSVDFERVLSAPTRARSSHFAVHHLVSMPGLPARPAKAAPRAELSTSDALETSKSVDDLPPAAPIAQSWLGAVVPKRHARRSVTRSLLKRQIRAAVGRQAQLPGGLWVVRLRAPFDRHVFLSAASSALRKAARDELDALLASAVRRSTGA